MQGLLPIFLMVIGAAVLIGIVSGALQALGIQICPECLREMPRGARRCPHCRAAQPVRQRKAQR